MRILSFVNISNFEDINSDSGYIFNYLLAEQFIKDGNEFAVIIPSKLKCEEKFKQCKVYQSDIGVNKYSSRFSFNWNALLEIIKDFSPNLIFLNQCELTSALKALLVSNKLNDIKILTYCHYPSLHVDSEGKAMLDYSLNNFGLGQSIVFNILSAVNVADYFVIQSDFAKKLLLDYANQHNFNLEKEIHVIPPPLDEFLLNKKPKRFSQKPNIIYNHRLYKSYGTDFLVSLVKDLHCNFYILDPMHNRGKERSYFNSSPNEYSELLKSFDNVKVFNGSESRSKYKKYLKQGNIAVGCYRKACVWSMAVVDCLCIGIPVIAPNFAAYPEFIPSILTFNNKEEAEDLIKKLSSDKEFYEYAVACSREILTNLMPKNIYKKFINLFGGDKNEI